MRGEELRPPLLSVVRLHLPHRLLGLHRPHPSTPNSSNTELANDDGGQVLVLPLWVPRSIHLLTLPRNKAITHLTHLQQRPHQQQPPNV